ncbi:hypothetical protein I350_00860 [Cryptococcus amylolentus CBS 6273]|nr:hypothetical protein I350_00860 [Cryptococcus amylolentus CBS 6273]
MYGGPPFPGSLPPFPPQRPPQNGMPSYLPPFPPSPFIPPGISPNANPGTPGQYPPQTPMPGMMGMPPMPPGMRPPPPAMAPSPARPSHPGLGSQYQPHHGLPRAPNLTPGPPRADVKTTKVFVGGIAPGISDETLTNLLNACGPLYELKRVIGASGKPQAFGFASFENPEIVLRAIRCLNGVELPDITPQGKADGAPKKKLVVKADEKTTDFLNDFEAALGRSDSDEQADAITRKSIQHIVALLTDPNAQHPDGSSAAAQDSHVIVPPHLQDLQEGDLPEDQRVAVLDQIAIFRENAAKREREKKLMEEEKERFKAQQNQGQGGYGRQQSQSQGQNHYGNRGSGRQQEPPMRQFGTPQGRDSAGPSRTFGSRDQGQQRDPQAYDKPVNFVAAQTVEGKVESGRTDEEEEEFRRAAKQRDLDIALRDAERRVEARERSRLTTLNNELQHRQQTSSSISSLASLQSALYATLDDSDPSNIRLPPNLGPRDASFFNDRNAWRARRQRVRANEYQADLRDRQAEEDERVRADRESEEFLRRQMAELKELEERQRARGLLTEDAAPIKLALSAAAPPPQPKEEKKPVPHARPGVQFDEDEDDNPTKKRRTFVKLDDDDAANGGEAGLSEAEKMARRIAKLVEIKKDVPRDRRGLWRVPVEWAAISDRLNQNKIKPFINAKITDYLGEPDVDLVNFVLEHLQGKKGPDELRDDLEPVLAEDAEAFVILLWRQLVFESFAYKTGTETGDMMI